MIASDAERLARIVAAEFRRRLLDEQLPRLRRCAELLGDARIWQRPHRHGNSTGNLLLHLAGNTTQWILATFGAVEDRRERAAEFTAEGGRSAAELLDLLERTYTRAVAVVEALPVAELLRPRLVQGYQETGLSAVLHVLEHGAGHAYQIYAATKQALDVDLRFYDL
ncbi:MAG: DUF664 domain-containing protein [Planctomycetes bacterium]|nr:DUF664 domain-containing protein [Planctomycetota bacterium]